MYFYLMCLGLLPVDHMHFVSLEARGGLASSGIGVTDGCTRPCQY